MFLNATCASSYAGSLSMSAAMDAIDGWRDMPPFDGDDVRDTGGDVDNVEELDADLCFVLALLTVSVCERQWAGQYSSACAQ